MSDPALNNPGDTFINDNGDVSPNPSGIDPGTETAIIVNVIVWVFIGSLFLFLYCTVFRRIFRANNSRAKASSLHWLWRKRKDEAAQNEAAGVELGRADRELAVYGGPEGKRIEVARTGGRRRRTSFVSKLVAILFRKKKEDQSGERTNLGSLQSEMMSTSTSTPSSGSLNEEGQPSVILKLKKLFMTKEGKGKETQRETRRESYFRTDVVSLERRNGGDEESLKAMEENREALEDEVKKPAKRSTWGSEALPPYESLAEYQGD